MKDKLIGTAYVNIIKDKDGQIKFAYGYGLKGFLEDFDKLAGTKLI